MRNVFDSIPIPRVGRSFFDLSHTHKFDCDAGQIIPFVVFPFMPGDHFKIGNNIVVRPQPMVTPILSEVKVYTYYFAVSNRIMFGEMVKDSDDKYRWEIKDRAFERFISGGESGDDDSIEEPLYPFSSDPVVNDNWNGIAAGETGSNKNDINVTVANSVAKYSLWDYFGLPAGVVPSTDMQKPRAYPLRAYNLIYNWYFRDKNFMDEVDVANNLKVMNCCWKKDYFTSALPWTQRGPVPTIPITSVFSPQVLEPVPSTLRLAHHFTTNGSERLDSVSKPFLRFFSGSDSNDNKIYLAGYDSASGGTGSIASNVESSRHEVTADDLNTAFKIQSSTGITINDLRLTARLQQWMERNAITGIDYRQFILAHFGLAPADERLQKPLFLGSSINPLWISEVVQTSESSETPQGHLSGHGLTAGSNFVCRYSAKEFGWIIGVMVIKPTASYQQGIPRYLLYQNRYDYPFPEFTHLGERAIYNEELYLDDTNIEYDDDFNPSFTVFGYTGIYNELRYMNDIVSGGLRDSFNYWHWGRIFANPPALNSDFLKMRPDKRIFLVHDEPSFICNVGNVIQAWRPLPKYPTPSLL